MPDILDTLKKEHDELRKLFKQLTDTGDTAEKTRSDLLEKIRVRLVGHARGEEAVFYPAFRKRGDHEDLGSLAEAFEEHRAVEKTVLPDLKKAAPGSRKFAGISKVLKEFVEHHAKEEEGTMFAAARKLFDDDEREALDKQYKAWKRTNGY